MMIGAFGMLSFLLTLAFYAFVVYVMVMAVRFFRQKTLHDQERIEKLDQLIRLLSEKEKEKERQE